MAKRKPQKRKVKPQVVRYTLITAALIILIYVLSSGPRGTWKLYRSGQEKEQLQEEIRQLEARKAALDSERTLLENDPAYIEKVAREKYNMKKKGEKVYRVDNEGEN